MTLTIREHLVAPSDHPTIDIPDCASHPAGVVAEQENDGICNIIRCADAANRMNAVECCQRFVDAVSDELPTITVFTPRPNNGLAVAKPMPLEPPTIRAKG